MAIDHINIDRSKQLAADLIDLGRLLSAVRDKTRRLVAIANHQWDTDNYGTLETRFGIETSKGADALFLLNVLHEILNTTTTVSGADRLTRLDDFCARLGQ